jgi:hypothetical protein
VQCNNAGDSWRMGSWSWWAKILSVGFFSVFFLIFGIEILIGSYGLRNPQIFVMYFFSGSFISLIGLIGMLYPLFQIYEFLRPQDKIQGDD